MTGVSVGGRSASGGGVIDAGRRALGVEAQSVRVDVEEKPARLGVFVVSVDAPALGVGEVESVLGPGDGDVGETALLGEFLGVVVAETREGLFFEADDEDGVELQALGAVDGHEGDSTAVVVVGLAHQGRAVEKRPESNRGIGGRQGIGVVGNGALDGLEDRRRLVVVFELLDGADEFAEVAKSLLGTVGVGTLEVVRVAGSVQEPVDDFRQRLSVDQVVASLVEKLAKGGESALGDPADGVEIVEDRLFVGVGGAGRKEFAVPGGIVGDDGRILEVIDAVDGEGGPQFFDRLGPDAAARGVDDAGGGDVVAGIEGGAEVGEDVFDLFSVIEAEAADDPVVDAVLAQLFFEESALGVDPVEDGEILGVGAAAQFIEDCFGDPGGLFAVVAGGKDGDGLAAGAVGPQLFGVAPFVVGDDIVGGIEDQAGGSVVLFEFDDFGLVEGLVEAEDVARVGAAPAVDRLVVVADDGEVFVGRRQVLEDLVLGGVGVLEFVDEEVAPQAAEIAGKSRFVSKQPDRLEDEIAEVDGVGLAQCLLVATVKQGIFFGPGIVGLFDGLLCSLAPVFAGVDVVSKPPDFGAVALLLVGFEDVGDQLLLIGGVVDREVPVEAGFRGVASKQACAEAVEGRDDDPGGGLVVGDEPVDTAPHLVGGPVGERDGDDGVGGDIVDFDQMGDAMG